MSALVRLDSSDAQFVDVIHTNGAELGKPDLTKFEEGLKFFKLI